WWGGDDPRALNNLAYVQAVANRDLDAALADAEQAIKLVSAKRGQTTEEKGSSASGSASPNGASSSDSSSDSAEAAQNLDLAMASYLDTRGFIRFRLAQKAKPSDPERAKTLNQALADFDEAIRLLNRSKKAATERLKGQTFAQQVREGRQLNESLGLMH